MSARFLLRSLWLKLSSSFQRSPVRKKIPDSSHIARICKSSTVPDGELTPAAFEFRFNETEKKYEEELSVHWIEFHGPAQTMDKNLSALAKFLLKPVIPKERSIGKNDRLAVLSVDQIHRTKNVLNGTRTTFTCFHSPRDESTPPIDSHSSIYPNPGVSTWPAPEDPETPSAYHFAVQSYLADLAMQKPAKIHDLAKT